MEVHRDINNLPKIKRPVLTIGTFDGVHRGHRALIDCVKEIAEKVKGNSVIVTFHPHPRQIVYPRDHELRILTTLEEKIRLMDEVGVDHLVIVPFTIEFSHLSAEEYITQFLVAKFSPHTIVVGYDHQFGRNRTGNVRLLLDYGRRYKFNVEEVSAELMHDMTISSTKIRNAISVGDMELAEEYLSYNYRINGEVVHGLKIGNQIGFPTANLKIKNPLKLLPPNGIYAVKVHYEGKTYDGMLYIGTRSTVSENGEVTIEVNIFNFNQSLYGEEISIEFISFIRNDEKFNSIDELRTQLLEDKETTESILNARQ